MIDVQLARVSSPLWRMWITFAGEFELKDKRISVRSLLIFVYRMIYQHALNEWSRLTFPHDHKRGIYVQRNEAYSMGQHFVDNNTCIVPEICLFYANCRHLKSYELQSNWH